MTKTKASKRRNANIREFRRKNDIDRCKVCGNKLGNSVHHFLCPKCWKVQQNYPVFDRPVYINKHKTTVNNHDGKEATI